MSSHVLLRLVAKQKSSMYFYSYCYVRILNTPGFVLLVIDFKNDVVFNFRKGNILRKLFFLFYKHFISYNIKGINNYYEIYYCKAITTH